jgi:hypothetical protein
MSNVPIAGLNASSAPLNRIAARDQHTAVRQESRRVTSARRGGCRARRSDNVLTRVPDLHIVQAAGPATHNQDASVGQCRCGVTRAFRETGHSQGLEALRLSWLPPAHARLWMLNAVRVPDDVDEAAVQRRSAEGFRDRGGRRARAARGQDPARAPDGCGVDAGDGTAVPDGVGARAPRVWVSGVFSQRRGAAAR